MITEFLVRLHGLVRGRQGPPSWRQIADWVGESGAREPPDTVGFARVAARIDQVNVIVSIDSAYLILTALSGDQLAVDLSASRDDELYELMALVPRDRRSREARIRFGLI